MATPDAMDRALRQPAGPPGSGRQRYAAAMARHAQGALSDAALEAYRTLSARDRDGPAALLGAEDIPILPPMRPEEALEALLAGLVALLRRRRGPGVVETRGALAAAAGPPQPPTPLVPAAAAWLDAALAAVAPAEPGLACAVADAAPHLRWRSYGDYDEAEIGLRFASGHAFASLLGEANASLPASGVDVGLFLMASGLFYRDHAHPAPELYLPLTGPHSWRFAPGAPLVGKAALVPVWNDPERPHAIKAGAVPFLALYAWLDRPQASARVVPAGDWARHEAVP